MLNLLFKEFITARIALITTIIIGCAATYGNLWGNVYSLVMILFMMTVQGSTFTEHYFKTDIIINSLPVTRKEIVQSKYAYLISILVLILAIVYGSLSVSWLISGEIPEAFHCKPLETLVTLTAFMLIASAPNLPIQYGLRHKPMLGNMISIAASLGIFAGIMFVMTYLSGLELGGFQISFALLIIGIILFIASYMLSLWIYKKNDIG